MENVAWFRDGVKQDDRPLGALLEHLWEAHDEAGLDLSTIEVEIPFRGIESLGEALVHHLMDTHDAEYCVEYGEPGYRLNEHQKGILFANWNEVPKAIQELAEELGYELEWSDEWYVDYDHNKAYRTQADSYHWQSSIYFTENGSVLTPDDSTADWVAELMNDPRKAVPDWIGREDLQALGFDRFPDWDASDYENGWHPGQTDDPKEIAKEIERQFPGADYVFRITEVSQFYLKFEAWYRLTEDGHDVPV